MEVGKTCTINILHWGIMEIKYSHFQTPYYASPIFHLLAFAGIEKPLVIKSTCFSSIPFLFENKLFTFSFAPSFLRLFRSSCSASTFAVRDAVSAFLMLLSGFSLLACVLSSAFLLLLPGCSPFTSVLDSTGRSVTVASLTVAVFFLFLPAPGAFFNECVRP